MSVVIATLRGDFAVDLLQVQQHAIINSASGCNDAGVSAESAGLVGKRLPMNWARGYCGSVSDRRRAAL
jgi:hypothetical protein